MRFFDSVIKNFCFGGMESKSWKDRKVDICCRPLEPFVFFFFLVFPSGGGDANLAKSAIKYECGLVLLLSTGWPSKFGSFYERSE